MSSGPAAIPRIGLGTAPGEGSTAADLEPALAAGLAAGYRLVDTAEVYGSEPLVGRLLGTGRADRRDLFVVSKLWQTNHAYDHAIAACERSLARLGVEALDLYLVHSPEAWSYCGPLDVAPGWSRERIEARAVPRDAAGEIRRVAVPLEETWAALLELRRRGLARAVGLANVDREQLEALAAAGMAPPAAVQVEVHPARPRRALRRFCAAAGIRVLAHSPLAGGRLVRHPRVIEIAAELGASPARAVLGWHLAQGMVPIVGSRREPHLLDDLGALGLELPPDAIRRLDRLEG